MIYNLSQILERTAELFPEKDAFKCLDDSISYEALDAKANQLASYLLEQGVRKEDRIGICMNRCLDSSVAIYGILRAGCVFVAIDPFLPLSRKLMIMRDCGIEHLVTTSTQSLKIKPILEEATFLKSIVGLTFPEKANAVSWESIFSRPLHNWSPPHILEEDLASILYTSGSTGVPKGIMHSHHSLLSLAKLEANLHSSTHEDRIGNFAPLHFDQSLFGYFSGPLVGATTIIFPDSYVKLPASLSTLAEKEKITLWFSVPLILMQVLQYGSLENKDFSSLRWVRFGGEVFPVNHLRELMLQWPHVKFINSYGPSEIARCTYYILEKPPATDDPIPLGTVWGNTEYKIVDDKDQEVTLGGQGELLVRTATRMVGYWNNETLTEKAFFRFKAAPGHEHIYYRTGDLVKENERNELMFLGRIDRQIKLRGYRIELDEIESVLVKHEQVNEAAVIVVNRTGKDREIEAVVRLYDGANVEASGLIGHCSGSLPSYAVPQTVHIINDFPRTGTGKIDRNEITKWIETSIL